MFVNNTKEAQRGGKAVAVPGEIKGLWELHQQFGSLPWSDLIQPVIELCRQGHIVSPYLQNIFQSSEADLLAEPSLREIFINSATNKTYQLGDKIKRLKLADTLEIIAAEGADAIYGNGKVGKMMIEDVQARGGILTEDDLREYKIRWLSPYSAKIIKNHTLFTMPLPSSGAILPFIFNILQYYELNDDALSYHRIIEAFKFAYAKRTFLGDEDSAEIKEMIENLLSKDYADEIRRLIDVRTYNNVSHYGANYYNKEDHGTAHVSILAPNGDAIAVTNTINYKLGAFFRSQQTGIIMNNEMDDFSTPGELIRMKLSEE
jgi:gamma-glutamyltranspeptidase/glutathione hydrolase/leukotriene-C4 hydrolase